MFPYQDCDGKTWSDMQAVLCKRLAELYGKHAYVYETLSEYDKKNFNQIRSGKLKYENEITKDALVDLSKHLRKYYQKPCIILIDEYDRPLDIAYRYQYYDEAREFFAFLFGRLFKVSIYFRMSL
jgi:hypothetical protein